MLLGCWLALGGRQKTKSTKDPEVNQEYQKINYQVN
jgi:hypothetical protein